jgi:hypothetical protein
MFAEHASARRKYRASSLRSVMRLESSRASSVSSEAKGVYSKAQRMGSTNSRQTPSLVRNGLAMKAAKEMTQSPRLGSLCTSCCR